MKYGFITVAAAVPAVKVADTDYNVREMESLIAQAEGKGVGIICFPHLAWHDILVKTFSASNFCLIRWKMHLCNLSILHACLI